MIIEWPLSNIYNASRNAFLRSTVMAELTRSELKATCRVLAHFLDGGWTEIMESRDEEESEKLFDTVESAHEKLSRMSRGQAA